MNPFLNTPAQELYDIMLAFGNTPVEQLAPRGYKKYTLNKLRWIPIDFGLSHFKLCYPPMPILDLIQIGASLEEQITQGSVFEVSAYFEILSARNIIRLLDRAYSFNENVKHFYDLKIQTILCSISADDLIDDSNKLSSLSGLLQKAAITPNDTIKSVADFILLCLEPIVDLADSKNIICHKITKGTNEEKKILFGYELYFLLFPMFFSWKLPSSFSTLFLGEKYRKRTRFWDEYDVTPIDTIHEYTLSKRSDH